jgi:hypothetical protein
MKRQWRVRRETAERSDARQRWDRAYQSILRWSLEAERASNTTENNGREGCHAGGGVRAGLDPGTGEARDH